MSPFSVELAGGSPDFLEIPHSSSAEPFNVAVVALANRQARLVWALLAHDREDRKDHVSRPPRS